MSSVSRVMMVMNWKLLQRSKSRQVKWRWMNCFQFIQTSPFQQTCLKVIPWIKKDCIYPKTMVLQSSGPIQMGKSISLTRTKMLEPELPEPEDGKVVEVEVSRCRRAIETKEESSSGEDV